MSMNLSVFQLDTPVKDGMSIQIISSDDLLMGYTSQYFNYNNDASVNFIVPTNGATTTHSKFPRCELREVNVWEIGGNCSLNARFSVVQLAGGKGMIVGQIHGDNNKLHPQLVKLYWREDNTIMMEYQSDVHPGKELQYSFGTYKLGESITYLISVDASDVSVSISSLDDMKTKIVTFTNTYWSKQNYYFKAGNYTQCNQGNNLSIVKFYKIQVTQN